MYKLIIGNIRITVSDDTISHEQATSAARQSISAAQAQGKVLSHIEISKGETGLEVTPTEKSGHRTSRKTIKQSLLDGMHTAIQEKLYPTGTFSNKDLWYDGDTGQEWSGEAVQVAREEVVEEFEKWMKTV
ncbi:MULTISPECIES: hypothetical protein [Pelosinus]|jgi:hypothetical protein|uniref:Uncharacterized protein n=2 Tax=Pelosinus TaxID=365348 RepID=I8U2Z5_9FIRM|nr:MULTISPECIES: hypothetical protein [Pelosinus]AJQ27202.1 hypothetical protein JBW_01852 [Pelosinus fermentans JBW45]MCC5466425.1 hypothetical protein [Pelosinus baikalensis]